jgi:hypothetical protein
LSDLCADGVDPEGSKQKKELDANNEKGRKQDENEYKKRMELE